MSLKTLIFGRRLANREQSAHKLGVFAGVPAVGLDGLASSAYGPEAALTLLIPLGAAGLSYFGPIIFLILALLAILYLSYRQTIAAYPNGGGSYTVAKENLGVTAGLVAAAALLIDYTLNVAVAISAGVAALISAAPSLHPHTLSLCLVILGLITLVNLRGTRESGLLFSAPTYLFLATFLAVLGLGLFRSLMTRGHPSPIIAPPAIPNAGTEAFSLWIFMRSFASGCTAMTGVEAVSNGVTAFKEPPVRTAHRTLTVICVMLGLLLLGQALLCRAYRVGALDQNKPGYQSVLSQLVGAVAGRGFIYYFAMANLLAVLCLSANTSFVGFPRLSRLIAGDRFLPHAFTVVGRRLVYSVGIIVLTSASGALLIAFHGITDRLIPLFAIGAFTAFTASQAGMVMHWRKMHRSANMAGKRTAGNVMRLCINAVGAAATGAARVVIILAKFTQGAWITLLAIPCFVAVFYVIRRHYARVERELVKTDPLRPIDHTPPVVLLPTAGWDRATAKSLGLAMRLSPDVTAVHLRALEGEVEEAERRLRNDWDRNVEAPARQLGRPVPELTIIDTPYRRFCDPLLKEVHKLKQRFPHRQIAVVMPLVVKRHWWQFLLHGYRAERLRFALLQHGDRQLVLINVPWYLHEDMDAHSHTDCAINADD